MSVKFSIFDQWSTLSIFYKLKGEKNKFVLPECTSTGEDSINNSFAWSIHSGHLIAKQGGMHSTTHCPGTDM